MLPSCHPPASPSILLVDDDPDELLLAEECFRQLGLCGIAYFTDAAALLTYLQALTAPAPLPRLIISDLNMPGITGLQLLRELKKDIRFADIPVMIYSTSSYTRHREECLQAGAADFHIKPSSFLKMMELFQSYRGSALPAEG